MEKGDRVRLVYGGGHVGVITAVREYQVAYPMDGKPASGLFSECELELTDEEPQPRGMGFRLATEKD
jgi:hypothetical protein